MPLFDLPHLLTLATVLTASVSAFFLGRRDFSRALMTATFISILLGGEASIAALAIQKGLWSYDWALPLQLCDLALILVVIQLLWPRQWIGELAYFWALGGSTAALLTPELDRAFPDPFYILFFLTHGGAIAAVCYLLGRKSISLDEKSPWRVWASTHLYAVVILIFNSLFQTNYLFLCEKPEQFSLLDYFGPWPVYFVGLELFFLLSLFCLYGAYRLLKPSAVAP